ncbi:SRPBCC family protein [Pseudonocardia sp. HH130630-07]|uniref:SRPBCC family protein n=1 Tax=Pseudonocardia sp. HH130630-07 TaxID=1690815 RepID=UPI000815052C|nr:SRPBCC family protein [Pseudonocardia sp. HH130630-07]ANY05437.1 hypothetical protein AFB00_02955 [Pseudonocardia sp. HH130630-07]
MDLVAEFDRNRRAVGGSGPTRTITLYRHYPAGTDEVWQAWTDPARLARWFEPVSGDLREGGRYTLTDSGTEGTVQQCSPPHTLRVSWEYEGSVSTVRLTLAAVSGGTDLELCHEVPADEHWHRFGPAAAGIGWEFSLVPLAMHLAGDPRRPSDVLEDTEFGRERTRHCATLWGTAHGASGVDGVTGDAAAAAAARTVEFYLDPG